MKSLYILTILTIICLQQSTNGVQSLRCFCNVCDQEETCEPSINNESHCFKSVAKVSINETFTTYEYTFGCLSGGDGILAPLQCHTNNLKGSNPRLMACCRDRDYCNEDLPDPDMKNDPRWIIDPPIITPKSPLSNITERFSYLTPIMILIFVFIFGALINCYRIATLSKIEKQSRGSTCSLKTDLEKFHHDSHSPHPHHHHHHQIGGSSSVSTHSYSISEDLNQKVATNMTDMSHEESYETNIEQTSGIGGRMLNPRTMARVVGFGKTDHVGDGRFGRVFRAEYHGEDVAVKAFRTIDLESWRREDTIFRLLNHENIVRFIASETSSMGNNISEIWMFLEYCPYGSLCDYLDTNEILGQQQAIKIIYSIINGLNYLHEDYATASKLYKPSIAHRDIKSKNILMKTPESCCIADFGHALVKIDEDRLDYGKYQYLQVGTIRYMAPEILRPLPGLDYRNFSTFAQADLYQFGLILWEVCHRTALDILHPADVHKLPYDSVVPHNPDLQDMIKVVCDDQYRPPRYDKWERYPYMKKLANLMVECWRHNPKARMETLGVKKKLKEMHDEVAPLPKHPNTNFSISIPNYDS